MPLCPAALEVLEPAIRKLRENGERQLHRTGAVTRALEVLERMNGEVQVTELAAVVLGGFAVLLVFEGDADDVAIEAGEPFAILRWTAWRGF